MKSYKKITSLIIAATMISSSLAFLGSVNAAEIKRSDSVKGEVASQLTASSVDSKLYGDVNVDGVITVADVTAVQKHIVSLDLIEESNSVIADVNKNDRVDVADATLIQKYIAKIDEASIVGTPYVPDVPTTSPTESVEDRLKVTAVSNYFPEATAYYDADTNEVTVKYEFQSDKKILNIQAEIIYDFSVLTVSNKSLPYLNEDGDEINPAFPVFYDAVSNLNGHPGKILFNASNVNGYNFRKGATFGEFIFDVNPDAVPNETVIDLHIVEFTATENIDGIPKDYPLVRNTQPKDVDFKVVCNTVLS